MENKKNIFSVKVSSKTDLRKLLYYIEDEKKWSMYDTTPPTLYDIFMEEYESVYVIFKEGTKIYSSNPSGYINITFKQLNHALCIDQWLSSCAV